MLLTELLASERVPFVDHTHRHGRQGWVQVDCPQCGGGGGKYHCGLSLAMPVANCWRCGRLSFWDVMRGLVTPKALRQLTHGRSVLSADTVKVTDHQGKYTPPKGLVSLLDSPAHMGYLTGRGLDPMAAVSLWGARAIQLHSRLPWRIWLPINYRGKAVSWTTRAIVDGEKKKYISAAATDEDIPHKHVLYGLDYCVGGVVVVHEGPLDVWNIGPGATCTFGTHYTDSQIALISRFPRRVICFDNSPEAQARADVLCSNLALWPGVTERVVLDADDPGSATKQEVALFRRTIGLD